MFRFHVDGHGTDAYALHSLNEEKKSGYLLARIDIET